jgi:ADP-ribose pyrophosphatase YjhB (NUDIX family)
MCATPLITCAQMGEDRLTCPNCGWIYYADPKVAAGILAVAGEKVLLVRRIMQPYTGLWSIPAGFVNAFEDPAKAAIRECSEETGLQATIDGLFEIFTGREHPRGADIFLVYKAQITGGELCAADDVDQAGWFQLDSLPELAFNSTKKILNQLMHS